MASLTPGVLLKLVQNVDNKDAKIVGEHRSALLQVIGILPSLEDDPWKSMGFYLRVSDSEHSAYVSVSDEDAELVLSDKIQLGQFIHVTRLDRGSPVPVLRGVKPVPKRRPCIGEPKDLISSDVLSEPKKVKKSGEVRKTEAKAKGSVRSIDLKSRRHSIDAGRLEMRRGWDSGKNGVGSVPSSMPKKEKDLTPRRSRMDASPFQNKNTIAPQKLVSKKDVQSSQIKTPQDPSMKKVDVTFKNSSGSKLLWSSIPSTMKNLGKEVMAWRMSAFCSAMQALEEASAAEGVICCMSMFAEVCELSDKSCSGPVMEKYLNLEESMKRAVGVIQALMNRKSLETKTKDGTLTLQHPSPEMFKNVVNNKNAALWVQAAVETNLSKLCLFSKPQRGEKHYYAIIDKNSSKKAESDNLSHDKNKKTPRNPRADVHKSCSISAGQNKQRGDRLKDAANLAEKLLSFSRTWFLRYLETKLNTGFGMQKGECRSPEVARLLGLLKRVNHWLDECRQEGDEAGDDEKNIEGVRKKLYSFLLDHVDSSIAVD